MTLVRVVLHSIGDTPASVYSIQCLWLGISIYKVYGVYLREKYFIGSLLGALIRPAADRYISITMAARLNVRMAH